MLTKWDNKFINLASFVKGWSKDKSTQTSAVIVDPESNSILSIGYNGFPRGVNDQIEERYERPQKYRFTEHAERNAIYNAARNGIRLNGSVMYLEWYPCCDCARAIIQSGISALYCGKPNFEDERWGEDFKITKVLFEESNIQVNYIC